MFDPVWFGNHIVPRWEALALSAVPVLLAALVFVLAYGAYRLGRRLRL